MAANEQAGGHLSDYERAVCYHTLPRVNNPLTLGLVVAYAVCLVEAVAAIAVGVYLDKPVWLRAGAIALIALICFGLVVFTARAFLNDLRRRRILAAARGVPDARDSASDLPDPFEDHILLHHPSHIRGTLYCLTDNHDCNGYRVKADPGRRSWTVSDIGTQSALRLEAVKHGRSFQMGLNLPAQLSVTRDGREVARIHRRFSLGETKVDIEILEPAPHTIQLRNEGFFADNRLVGRVYNLRGSFYLDIQKTHFNDGVLAYFVSEI